MNLLIIYFCKLFSFLSTLLNLGNGSTWPGHIALKINPRIINDLLKKSNVKIILVAGTNGKTTTAKILETIIKANDKSVFLNSSGANLLNGIASSIILNTNLNCSIDSDYVIFEVDENVVPSITRKLKPDFFIALNLFRDQLDRYGEINTIAKKWKLAFENLNKTLFILNADDPEIAFLRLGLKNVFYFGLNDKKFEYRLQQHASDSILCPNCKASLSYDAFYFSHLGKWKCKNCKAIRPKPDIESFKTYPLLGTYAIYDTLAAVLCAQKLGISDKVIDAGIKSFKPAFGRQEITKINNKRIQIFLSKNPTSFNESLRTINANDAKHLLIILNDRIPDGTDISWIWDVDFETLISSNTILVLSGDRSADLYLRLKYAGINVDLNNVFDNLEEALKLSLSNVGEKETLYVLPTYSAMLEIRKILTGKEIL